MLEPPGRLGPQGPGAAFVLFSRAVKKRATRAGGSALTLLVTQVLADHHDPAMTANHLALVADLLDARMNLHLPAVLIGLFVSDRGCGPFLKSQSEWLHLLALNP